MHIGICSDVEEEIILISNNTIKYGGFLTEDRMIFLSPEDVLVDIETQHFQYDILFMKTNCQVDDNNGISIAKQIEQAYPKCQIIFYSNTYEQVSDVYDVRHSYFFHLDDIEKYIKRAIQSAERLSGRSQEDLLEFTCNRQKVFIRRQEILYIKREQRCTIIYTLRNQYPCYIPLTNIIRMNKDNLIRCHTGYIVNTRYIVRMSSDHLLLENNTEIPIGRAYKNQMKSMYESH